MVDVESADNVGLIDHTGGGDVRIVNRREMDHRFGPGHSLHDLAEILDISDQVFYRATLRSRHAVEDSDFVSRVLQELANDSLTDFAHSTGDKQFHR
jgi:hypothetical protein